MCLVYASFIYHFQTPISVRVLIKIVLRNARTLLYQRYFFLQFMLKKGLNLDDEHPSTAIGQQ